MTHPLNTDSLSFTHQPSICPITFHFPPFHYSSSRDHPLSITYLPVCSIHPPSVCDHPFSHPPPVNSYLHSPATHHIFSPATIEPLPTIHHLVIHAALCHPTLISHTPVILQPPSLHCCPLIHSLTISHQSIPHPSRGQHKTLHHAACIQAHLPTILHTPDTRCHPSATIHSPPA